MRVDICHCLFFVSTGEKEKSRKQRTRLMTSSDNEQIRFNSFFASSRVWPSSDKQTRQTLSDEKIF